MGWFRSLCIAVPAPLWAVACGGLVDSTGIPEGPVDADAPDSGEPADSGEGFADAVADVSTVIEPGPSSLLFHNQEEMAGLASGAAVLRHAADESAIQTYTVYWGGGGTKLGGRLASFLADGTDHVLLIDDKTATPVGATQLLAYGNGPSGESAPVSASLAFVPPAYFDISAGASGDIGEHVCAAFDSTNDKVIVETGDLSAPGTRTFTCKPSGKGCATQLFSTSGQQSPDDVILDVASKKLIAMVGVSVVRCNLDGTACSSAILDATVTLAGAGGRQLAIDSVSNKLLGAGSAAGTGHALLFRCNLDATACSTIDLTVSAGSADGSGYYPSMVVDAKNKKLLVTVYNWAGGSPNGLNLLVCNLDGTGCVQKDVSAGAGATAFGPQKLLFDPVNDRLALVTAEHVTSSLLGLYVYKIALDGSSSSRHSVGVTDVAMGEVPAALIDPVGQRLVVAYSDTQSEAGMVTCHLDGTACRARSLALGMGLDSAKYTSAAFDPISRMLFVATDDQTSGWEKPGLVIFGL